MRARILIVILTQLFFVNTILATEISPSTAKTVAKNFFSELVQESQKEIQIKQVFTYQNANNIPVYIVTFEKGGYVMVSGDDSMEPVIGYALEGEIPTLNQKTDLHPMLQTRLNKTIRHARRVQSNHGRISKWEKLKKSNFVQARESNAVAPLIQTLWKQGSPYNQNFPTMNGTKTLTGCMPTAVSQIMKYYNHPAQATGSTSYYWERGNEMVDVDFSNVTFNWSAMPNTLTSASSATAKQEVSNLMYYVAAGIQANFGRDQDGGTDASAIYIEDALGDYFGYDKSSMYAAALAAYTTSEWRNLIKNELDASRPVLYTGQDGNLGHAFVCDGYDFTNGEYFHINWGWGGILNGYFLLNNLDTDGNVWDDNNLIIVGIQPDADLVVTPPAVPEPVVQKADLVIDNINASNISIEVGGTVTLTSKVKNMGNIQCERSSRVKYYISNDDVLDGSDSYEGYDYVGKLHVDATSNETIDITFPSDLVAGNYYVLLVADGTSRVNESDENNVYSIKITINSNSTPSVAQLADLAPDYSELNKTSAATGTYVYAYCEMSNFGTAKSGVSYMRYYLSADQQWDAGDKYLGYDKVAGIEPGAWGWEEINFKVPTSTAPGQYYVLFVADASNKVEESNENNNVRSEAITITGSSRMVEGATDLQVTAFPNPVVDHVIFSYNVETASEVNIQIFDLQGRLVKHLISEYQEAGMYQARWSDYSLYNLPSGRYMAMIDVGGVKKTVKLVK